MSVGLQPAILQTPSTEKAPPQYSPIESLLPNAAATTLSKVFLATVQQHSNQVACSIARSEGTGRERHISVVPWKWSEYGNAAKRFAKALIAQGVGPKEVVTIQGSNSPQWLSAHIGTILAGAISAGVYQTNGDKVCQHIVESSGAKIAVVEDGSQLKKYESVQSTALKCIVVWNKTASPSAHVPVLSMEEFLQTGDAVPDEALEARIEGQKADDPCALLYTSGTTGFPKAATLTHRNFTYIGASLVRSFSIDQSHRSISFLPLSHVAAMQVDSTVPTFSGHCVYIAPPDALKGSNLRDHIIRTKPTYFMAVPRVWEKFKEAIETKLQSASFLMRHAFSICTSATQALSTDDRALCAQAAKAPLPLFQRIRQAFDRCILSLLETVLLKKIKAALGLDQCLFAASGAGSMNPEILDFFDGLNIHILDFYGMSETAGPTAIPDNTTPRGSCGKPIPGTEIQVINTDEQGEGEILVRGPNVFSGYWNDVPATKEALDERGFLHTGDKGKIDAEGNLFVTGRIKELIKTSGGENIPPLRIEDRIKEQLPIVSQAVVIGHNRRFLTCLLTLKTEPDETGNPTDILTPEVISTLQKIGSSATTLHEASADQKIKDFLHQGIQRANQFADSHAQFVQKVTLLPEDLSIPNGTLTPTLKLRRPAIEQKWPQEIAEMYAKA